MSVNICETPSNFTLPVYNQPTESFTLSANTEKVILLSFMNIGCGHCWSWFPRWESIHADYSANPNVKVVVVMFNNGADSITDDLINDELTTRGLPAPGFTLLKDSGFGGAVAGPYCSGFDSPVWYPYAYLISRSHLITNKWHWKSTPGGELVSFDSLDDNDVEHFIRHRTDDLLIDRERWNTSLALDYSGSMDSNTTVAGVTKPKIDFLREAVDVWLRVWKDYALCDDKLNVVYFRSNAESDGALVPILPGANIETIMAEVESRDADGCTAMGAAIATGIDVLETDPLGPGNEHKRFMVVFTDGKQNRNPMYVLSAECDSGGCIYQPQIRIVSAEDAELLGYYLCGSDGGLSDYSGSLPRIIHENPMDTKIHTIGIGAPESAHGLLTHISDQTSGVSYLDSDIWPDLKEFFLESLVESFRGASLQTVVKKTGVLPADEDEVVETFLLNRSVRKATILLSWLDESDPLDSQLTKDGVMLNLVNKQEVQPTFSITTIPFPLYQPTRRSFRRAHAVMVAKHLEQEKPLMCEVVREVRPQSWTVDAEGRYYLSIRRMFPDMHTDVTYHLMVLADDKHIEVELNLPRQLYYTGERIPITLKVSDRKQPLQKVFSARADVRRPSVSFGNLYVDNYKRLDKVIDPKAPDSPSCRYQAILGAMSVDPTVVQSMQDRHIDQVKLLNASKTGHSRQAAVQGLLKSVYRQTTVPGHYKIEAVVRGVSRTAGVFERVVTKTVLVVPRSSTEHSGLKGEYRSMDRSFTVTMTPADRYGNVLGPGYATQIMLSIEDVDCGTVKDNMDGSYEVSAKLPDKVSPRDATTALWVGGERLFLGSLEHLVGTQSKKA